MRGGSLHALGRSKTTPRRSGSAAVALASDFGDRNQTVNGGGQSPLRKFAATSMAPWRCIDAHELACSCRAVGVVLHVRCRSRARAVRSACTSDVVRVSVGSSRSGRSPERYKAWSDPPPPRGGSLHALGRSKTTLRRSGSRWAVGACRFRVGEPVGERPP